MHHLVKIFGGNMFQNWQYAAVALHFLKGFEERFARVRQKAENLFIRLNKIRGIGIEKFVNGSNVHKLFIENASTEKFVKYLLEKRNIIVRQIDEEGGFIPIKVNETQLNVSNDDLVESFQRAYSFASLRK
jgi:threonine aldolase